MRKKYGITWWGQQWLNAFNHISDANRLPRGRTYANTGRAKDIEIKGNIITAKVSGSRSKPYKVKIEIPKFDKKQKEELLKLVQDNPLFLSQLLNRELPESFDKACTDIGIQIFPSSWTLLKASCSCPDWAMPCKHLASVLYLVANEIDKNPFLVLQLHDFDLIKLLEESGVGLESQKSVYIKSVKDLWENLPKKKRRKKWKFEKELIDELDFSVIPECKESLMSILTESPVFYPQKDFKKILATRYGKITRNVNKELINDVSSEDDLKYEQIDNITIYINSKLKKVEMVVIQNNAIVQTIKGVEKLSDWIRGIDYSRIEYCIPKIQALYHTFHFSMKLAGQSAIIPQLLQISLTDYKIRWIPALLNPQVKEVFEKVNLLIPPDLIFYKETPLSEIENTLALTSFFLTDIVSRNNGEDYFDNNIEKLFFTDTNQVFGTFEDREYPGAIQLWLNKFYLTEKQHIPIIQVTDEPKNQFRVDLKIEDTAKRTPLPVQIKSVFSRKSYQKYKLEILKDLAVLANYFPEIERIIASKGKEFLIFKSDEFTTILLKILPVIKLLGIKVLLPKGLSKLIRPSISMALTLDDNQNTSSGFVNLAEMLSFNWQVAMGDRQVSQKEFLKLVKSYSGIVKLKDEYVYFDEKEVAKLLDKLENPPKVSKHELLHAALSEDYEGGKVIVDKKVKKSIGLILKQKNIPVPKGLNATLRPYQERGYAWMYKNSQLGFGSLIADDMGLGKTIQVITTILKLKDEGRLEKNKGLIVVPTTLLTNWEREIEKFAPSISNYVYHGPDRKLETKGIDIIITTYGMIRSDAEKFSKKTWGLLAIDESQNIKNPKTNQTKAIKKIKAEVIIAMSGTPVENRLSEYWSVFDFTNKGYLGSLDKFKKNYALPIEVNRDKTKLDKFRKITAPFIMRRLKSDKSIIKDLPDKIENNQYCELTTEQSALYTTTVNRIIELIAQSEGIARKGLVLKLMTALKQICNHPTQFLKTGSSKIDLSGKSVILFDLLRRIMETGEKTLIFTQYREMGNLMLKMLKQEMGINAQFLHGGVTRKKRDLMVQDFQENHSTKIIILSLKAAGTGLNLTSASNVIHYDLWWNPAVESQATDRAYRIGQKKNVQVYRFITENTFEEKIDKMIQAKKELANLTVNTGEKWIGEMSNNDLRELVTLGGI